MRKEDMLRQLFTFDIDSDLIVQYAHPYILSLFKDETLTFTKIISFIGKYKDELINSALKDEKLIDNLLYKNNIIDRTKRHLINKQYFEDLIKNIKNKHFDPNTLTFYSYIISFINLYTPFYDEESIKDILNANIFSIVENINLISEDRRKIIPDDTKIELTNKLLAWNKKCGSTILPNVILLESLRNNITVLLNSNHVAQNVEYQKKLLSLLKICNYSIQVRDNNIIPNDAEVEQINNMFNEYNIINKSIILDTINENNILLVHFIKDNNISYQLIGNQIINTATKSNNMYDDTFSDFFVQSYIQNIISEIETKTGNKINLSDPEIREIIHSKLEYYNYIMNYRPLDRLPINRKETGEDLRTVIRPMNSRLSCSFISRSNPLSHLNRKVGIIIKPKNKQAILSTSIGYTEEKNFYDFYKDSVPSTQIFEQLDYKDTVNETCVDASECEIVGILLLSEEQKDIEKAQKVAQEYNVNIINLSNKKASGTTL